MHFQVGQANRKDVRNAVEVAKKSQPGWEKRSGFNRSQILFYIAENLELRAQEFAAKLEEMGTKVGLHQLYMQPHVSKWSSDHKQNGG